jgi:hypothetical protein
MLAIDARISSRSNGYGHPCAIAPSEPPNEPEPLSEVSSPVSSDYQHGEATTTNATAPSSQRLSDGQACSVAAHPHLGRAWALFGHT